MSALGELDLTELRRTWAARRAILQRIDPRGMKRPARDPDERAWLNERGGGVFVEDEAGREAARAYYERKYVRTTAPSSDPVADAADYGIDISLLRSGLGQTPDERLRQLDADAAFIREVRKSTRPQRDGS